MTDTDSIVVGIDLGTTNSSVAVVLDGELTVIPVHGKPSMPSAVGLDPAGKVVIGQAAKNQAVSAPENTVLSVKRIMGTDQTVSLGGREYRPEEISSIILGELKRAAEQHLGRQVSRAVITVPAFFNERQRQATADAGKLAGLEVMRIINEPTAAALAYGAGEDAGSINENILVYDLGGGTFDVSVVSVENGIVEVRASHGDIHLGGDDFDEELAKLAEQRLDLGGQEGTTLSTATHRRLRSIMERAKIELSDAPFATVREEYITETSHLDTEIARAEYEELIAPRLRTSLDSLQRALADAGVNATALDKVMLVGGATRTPLVHRLLENSLSLEPRHEINPDLVVAMGAAIQGAALAGQPAPAILIDISAHTYSTVAIDDSLYFEREVCVPLIRRGTPLPVTKSEVFFTLSENQKMVKVLVTQGESPIPEENLLIGNFFVDNLARKPQGSEIILRFSINLSGMLTVTATEKCTGMVKTVTIDTAGQHRLNLDAARTNLAVLFQDQDESEAKTRPTVAFNDDDDDDDASGTVEVETVEWEESASPADGARLLASAKSLRQRASTLLESGLAQADAESVQNALDAIPPSIEMRDWSAFEEQLDTLSDLLFYLED